MYNFSTNVNALKIRFFRFQINLISFLSNLSNKENKLKLTLLPYLMD